MLLALPAFAQVPLGNLNPAREANGSSNVFEGVVAQNTLFFSCSRWDTGTELWRSDGTLAGTRLVRDITLGASGLIQGLVTNGTIVFGQVGGQIVRSDGTEAGTVVVSSHGSFQSRVVTAGSRFVWQVDTGTMHELWSSDGTTAPAMLLLTMPLMDHPVASGARAWFAAGDSVNGWELWHTDGTAAGTVMLDVMPGSAGLHPEALAADGAGGVWFSGDSPGVGKEPWHSDGTLAGTTLVADVWAGNLGSSPRGFCSLGSRAFFAAQTAAGVELWVTDGTAANTMQLRDINPGNAHSSPNSMFAVPAWQSVVFSATEPVAGRELWISDGTAAGTQRLIDADPGNSNGNSGYDLFPFWYANALWFASTAPATGRELYRSDGTPGGTALAADLFPGATGSEPRALGVVNGSLLLGGFSLLGHELWKLTAPATTPVLLDLEPGRPQGSFPVWQVPSLTSMASLDGRQHFPASVPGQGVEPYSSDGTPAGTTLVGELELGPTGRSRLLAATSTHVYYETTSNFAGTTPRLVAVGRSGPPVVLRQGLVTGFAVLRDRLVFAQLGAGGEPMITNGTVAGTTMVFDVRPGSATSSPIGFTTVGDRVWFFADDGVTGREPWSTDGTAAGTARLFECVPGAGGVDPAWVVAGTSHVYFRAASMLWSTDGTAAGTTAWPSVPYSSERVVLGDVLLLASGNQLWRADGTVAGTQVIAQSDDNGEPIKHLCVARGLAFCSVERQFQGPELWRSDGTAAGTGPVLTLHPSPQAPAPPIAPAGLGLVAIARTDATNGTELWVSDGTAAGTSLVVDAEPGSAPSNPVFMPGDTTANRHFTWWADTVNAGLEPWSAPLSAFGGSDFDHYGQGCPGSRGVPHVQGDGLPILGSPRFAWQLRNALPGSAAVMVLGFARTPGASACWLLNSADVLHALPIDAAGHAEYALSVPNSAPLVGFVVSGQFVVIDPAGAFGFAAATAGLEALIGR